MLIAPLQSGKILSLKECPAYDTNLSDGDTPVLGFEESEVNLH